MVTGRQFFWGLTNCIMVAAAYHAYITETAPWAHMLVVVFCTLWWVTALLFLLLPSHIALTKFNPSVPYPLDLAFDVAFGTFLLYVGQPFWAAVYFCATGLMLIKLWSVVIWVRDRIEEEKGRGNG